MTLGYYPLLLLLASALDDQSQGMSSLLEMQVGMATALAEAPAVEASQAYEHAVWVILSWSDMFFVLSGGRGTNLAIEAKGTLLTECVSALLDMIEERY